MDNWSKPAFTFERLAISDLSRWILLALPENRSASLKTKPVILNQASRILGTNNSVQVFTLQHLEDKRATFHREIPTAVNDYSFVPLCIIWPIWPRATPVIEPTRKIEWFHDSGPLLDGTASKLWTLLVLLLWLSSIFTRVIPGITWSKLQTKLEKQFRFVKIKSEGKETFCPNPSVPRIWARFNN